MTEEGTYRYPCCGSRDDDKLSFGCDFCDEWWHGVCLYSKWGFTNVELNEMKNSDATFECPKCQAKQAKQHLARPQVVAPPQMARSQVMAMNPNHSMAAMQLAARHQAAMQMGSRAVQRPDLRAKAVQMASNRNNPVMSMIPNSSTPSAFWTQMHRAQALQMSRAVQQQMSQSQPIQMSRNQPVQMPTSAAMTQSVQMASRQGFQTSSQLLQEPPSTATMLQEPSSSVLQFDYQQRQRSSAVPQTNHQGRSPLERQVTDPQVFERPSQMLNSNFESSDSIFKKQSEPVKEQQSYPEFEEKPSSIRQQQMSSGLRQGSSILQEDPSQSQQEKLPSVMQEKPTSILQDELSDQPSEQNPQPEESYEILREQPPADIREKAPSAYPEDSLPNPTMRASDPYSEISKQRMLDAEDDPQQQEDPYYERQEQASSEQLEDPSSIPQEYHTSSVQQENSDPMEKAEDSSFLQPEEPRIQEPSTMYAKEPSPPPSAGLIQSNPASRFLVEEQQTPQDPSPSMLQSPYEEIETDPSEAPDADMKQDQMIEPSPWQDVHSTAEVHTSSVSEESYLQRYGAPPSNEPELSDDGDEAPEESDIRHQIATFWDYGDVPQDGSSKRKRDCDESGDNYAERKESMNQKFQESNQQKIDMQKETEVMETEEKEESHGNPELIQPSDQTINARARPNGPKDLLSVMNKLAGILDDDNANSL